MADPMNASSVHRHGQRARALLEEAREEIADLLGTDPDTVVFTSSATEANNLALRGYTLRQNRAGLLPRILTSDLEHACIRETAAWLGRTEAAEIIRLAVGEDGRADLHGAPPADLLCLMAVQNETGVIQDATAARAHRDAHSGLWLCDATQGLLSLDVSLPSLGADLVSLSSHKIHGPAGVGLLAGPGIWQLEPLLTGGPQEGELRAGTQPVALIRGFVAAARKAILQQNRHRERMEQLEALFLSHLSRHTGPFWINGGNPRVPGFLNLSFPGLAGADAVIALDVKGFSVSSGSACSTGVVQNSAALAVMFPNMEDRVRGGIRIVFGRGTTEADVISLSEEMAMLVRR